MSSIFLGLSGHQNKRQHTNFLLCQWRTFGDVRAPKISPCIPFDYGSPFFERFNEVTEKVRDFGLTKLWEHFDFIQEIIGQKSKLQSIEDRYNIKWISIVLIFGYFMAILIFLYEILINKCIEKINLKSII